METLKKYHNIVILKGGISDEYEISKLTANQVSETLKPLSNVKTINVEKNSKSLIEDLIKLEPDVVFNCLHGYFGEDGQVQSILNYLKMYLVMNNRIITYKEKKQREKEAYQRLVQLGFVDTKYKG